MTRILSIILLATLPAIISIGGDIHSTKTVKFKGYEDSHSISLEYDSAVVSFGLQDVRDELIKLKSKRTYQGRDFQRYFSETLKSITVDQNYLFKSKEIFSSGGIIEQYVLRTLISRGKSKVLNKTTNKYLDKIKRTHYRITMAGERHEGYEFAFMNGTIFLIDRISI